jgi:hypothetical protein
LNALAPTTGIHLVGPFEVLAGRFDARTPAYHQHLHWRYTYDPPEFFTVCRGDADGLHYGYYLDDPGHPLSCVAYYYASDAFELEGNCETLFEALRLDLEQHAADGDDREDIADLRGKLLRYATGERPETGESYVEKYLGARPKRFDQVVASTQEGMGIVVPPNRYRPLSLPDKKLWKALRKKETPTDLIVEAWQAIREGYPGTALKLGKDLWATMNERKRAYAYDLLDAAYASLGRELLRQVLAHHRQHPQLPWVDILHVEDG